MVLIYIHLLLNPTRQSELLVRSPSKPEAGRDQDLLLAARHQASSHVLVRSLCRFALCLLRGMRQLLCRQQLLTSHQWHLHVIMLLDTAGTGQPCRSAFTMPRPLARISGVQRALPTDSLVLIRLHMCLYKLWLP